MRRPAAVLLVAAAVAALAACTSGGSDGPPSSAGTSTIVTTITRTRTPAPSTPGPVSAGPTQATDASSCPYLGLQSAADTVGMRLDKIAVLKVKGTTVGCRFFALQHPNAQCSESCLAAEKLPPADQPAIEISSLRYPGEVAAHNALVLLSRTGTAVQQATIAPGNTGLCFQLAFYPKDKGQDWACAFNVKATLVVVKTVVTSPAFNAIQVAKAIAPKF